MKHIESEWKDFVLSVYGGITIPKAQYQVMRRCFYCGFISMLGMALDEFPFLTGQEISETINDYCNEVTAFKNELSSVHEKTKPDNV